VALKENKEDQLGWRNNKWWSAAESPR